MKILIQDITIQSNDIFQIQEIAKEIEELIDMVYEQEDLGGMSNLYYIHHYQEEIINFIKSEEKEKNIDMHLCSFLLIKNEDL